MSISQVKYRSNLAVMSPTRLMTAEEKGLCLRVLCESLRDAPPDRYGSGEPLKRGPLCEDIEQAVKEWSQWDQVLAWKRSKPTLEGDFFSSWMPDFQHSSAGVVTKDAHRDAETLLLLMDRFSHALVADLGVLHVIGEEDVRRGGHQGSGIVAGLSLRPWDFMLLPITHRIRAGLPDVYWSTILGRPYVDLIGRERLLACPDSEIVELGYGGIRITSRLPIHAARTRPEEFETWRDSVRDHIGREFFFDAPAYGLTVRVPNFAWVE